jgi:hypothetical protein
VPESEDRDDANDEDFSLGQQVKPQLTIKGPKKNTAAASGAPSRSGSRSKTGPSDAAPTQAQSITTKRKSQGTDPDGPQPSSKRQALESNVSPPSFCIAVSTVPKRKANIIDLEDDEPPPPK